MILQLRKRHLYTWALLGLLLPIGFIVALRSIPEAVEKEDQVLNFEIPEAFPKVESTAETNTLQVNLRSGNNVNQKQLEINLIRPVKNPAAVLYLGQQKVDRPDQGIMIGQLGPKGVHRINLDSTLSSYNNFHLLIYDPIKKEIIEQVSL